MKLAQYMEAHGLTDGAFADRVGVDRSRINRFRRGDAIPSWETARRIEEETGGQVTLSDLFPVPENVAIPHKGKVT